MDGGPWRQRGHSPFIISVAPNGARRRTADHPALPETAAGLAREAAACHEAGAALFHVHVRDRDGRQLLDAGAYREAFDAIRAGVGDGLILQASTEAVGRYTPDRQMAVIRELRPEAVSLALPEIMPDPSDEGPVAGFLEWLHETGAFTQFIIRSEDELRRYRELCRRGIVPEARSSLLFVLGNYREGAAGAPGDLTPLAGLCRPGEVWSVCAFGPRENACALMAAALGGHCRVGFENNLVLADGRKAEDNADLVRQAREGADLLGRTAVNAATAREIFAGNLGAEVCRSVAVPGV